MRKPTVIPLVLLVSVLVVARTGTAASLTDSVCTLAAASGDKVYDLRPLQRNDSSYEIDGYDTGYQFKLNVCGPLPELPDEDISAQWQRSGHHGSLGKANGKPRLRGERLLLEYLNGDECPDNSRLKQSALISFVCDRGMSDNGRPEFVAEWGHCAFMFEWRTQHACPVGKLDEGAGDGGDGDKDGGVFDGASRGAVIFVAIFVVGSLYILGGFLYNRVLNSSRGLRGLEQLPNYNLWHGIYLFFHRIFVSAADAVTGRRGALSVDSAEHNIRNELFDSDDDGDGDALPFTRR
ncbi:mannose 6-phosphate receptor domain-containing protein [Martensiomyces pterosporus]|nr:mannose 6-phosphate receptor domain-containing protein [Martensiomyces pterosporus]